MKNKKLLIIVSLLFILNSIFVILGITSSFDNAIYNFVDFGKISKYYPKKEISVKTFQLRSGYAIVVNNILAFSKSLKSISKSYNFKFILE